MKLFLVCDVDMTVALFKHTLAILRLKSYLDRHFSSDVSGQITGFVQSCFENFVLRARGLPHNEAIIQEIEEMSLCVANHEDSDAYWSRELWLYAASPLASRTISAQFAVDAAETYWRSMQDTACLYEDAQEFFSSSWWKNSAWELVLVTSSDARLRVSGDSNGLVYDPRYSDRKKRERIPPLMLFGISENNVFVGDPISKPDLRFWNNVATNIAYDPGEDIAVMVGDSPAVDLVGLPEGFIPILVDRDKTRTLADAKEAQIIIHGFDALQFILARLETQAKERR